MLLIYLLFVLSGEAYFPPMQAYPSETRILFLGNSLSDPPRLSQILTEIGENYGQSIRAECLCKANYALMDHWQENELRSLINKNQYDWIILQQGPSSQAYGRKILKEYGRKIQKLAQKRGSKIAYFMVWPSRRYFHTFEGSIQSYTLAAQQQQALLIPIGQYWQEYFQASEDFSLYQADGFHPSSKGSFFAAWGIFQTLFPDEELTKLSYERVQQYLDLNSFQRMFSILERTSD